MLLVAESDTTLHEQHIALEQAHITFGADSSCDLRLEQGGSALVQFRLGLSPTSQPLLTCVSDKSATRLNQKALRPRTPTAITRADVVSVGAVRLSLVGYPMKTPPLLPHVKQALMDLKDPAQLAALSKTNLAARRVIAAREDIPKELIESLCQEELDEEVIRILVANSLTPMRWLKRFIPFFPGAFLQNPLLPLLLLEDPLLGQLSEVCVAALLSQEEAPPLLVTAHAQNTSRSLCYLALRGRALSFEQLYDLASSDAGLFDGVVQREFERHPQTTREQLASIKERKARQPQARFANPPGRSFMPSGLQTVMSLMSRGHFPIIYRGWSRSCWQRKLTISEKDPILT